MNLIIAPRGKFFAEYASLAPKRYKSLSNKIPTESFSRKPTSGKEPCGDLRNELICL